jgi:hypothetical protein
MSRHAVLSAPTGRAFTTKIIAELEAGRAPWVQPWGTASAKTPLAMPRNAATGRRYSDYIASWLDAARGQPRHRPWGLAGEQGDGLHSRLPAGPKIAVTGGLDFNDCRLIWDRLDKVSVKHPDMVLLHGGSPRGAERIAARWADHRKVPQIVFKPIGRGTPRPRPSSGTTPCWRSCRLESRFSLAPASRATSPTKRRNSASRSGGSARELPVVFASRCLADRQSAEEFF